MSVLSNPLPAGPRRGASLALLIFSLIVTVSAFAQVGLARDGTLPKGMFGYGIAIVVLAGAAFFVVSRWAPYADPLLLPLAMFLNGIGLAMIYRIDQKTAPDFAAAQIACKASHQGKSCIPFGAGSSATTQLLWTVLGIGLFIGAVLLLRDLKVLERYKYMLGAAGLFFLVLPVFLPGINGSKIWITLPGIGSIQPSEFSKFALVTFFAGYLVNKRQALSLVGHKVLFLELPRAKDLFPILLIWIMSLGVLAVENDFGTALLFFGLFVSMLYLATGRASWVIIGLGLFVGGALLLFFLAGVVGGPLVHITQRVDIWLNPEPYFNSGCKLAGHVFNRDLEPEKYLSCIKAGGSQSDSAQLMQGLFAMAHGGVLGTGLGQGQPYITPLAFSDEIFTSLGEELGLAGLMAILMIYALIVQRGMKTALAARDPFSKLFAGGVSFVFALQVFAIVGGVTRLIPFTGLTTPFMAQGGSSLLANWILIAMLIRLSDQARRPAPQSIQDEGLTQVVSTR
jgi:cell division protein FtsW (lipid II flippase)